VRVSDKGLGKTEEKLRSWGKLSTTKDPRAQKWKSLINNCCYFLKLFGIQKSKIICYQSVWVNRIIA
jgi:hypothetical protein